MKLLAGRLGLIAALLAMWEISARTFADEFFVSRPMVIGNRSFAIGSVRAWMPAKVLRAAPNSDRTVSRPVGSAARAWH